VCSATHRLPRFLADHALGASDLGVTTDRGSLSQLDVCCLFRCFLKITFGEVRRRFARFPWRFPCGAK